MLEKYLNMRNQSDITFHRIGVHCIYTVRVELIY